jgi:hypothetical protein
VVAAVALVDAAARLAEMAVGAGEEVPPAVARAGVAAARAARPARVETVAQRTSRPRAPRAAVD